MVDCYSIVLFILTIILFGFLIFIVVKSQTCETFSNQKPKKKKMAPQEAWKKRFGDLRKVVPLFYKKYFNQVKDLPNPNMKPQIRPQEIFVSVASYRDNQCLDTVRNLAENADNPELLTIVVCQQNSTLEDDCLGWCKRDGEHPTCKYSRAKIERLSYISARGPTWARWRIQRKWNGEEYYLQVDAHTRMVKGWDTILKQELANCPSQKAVLTQYPLEYDIVSKGDRRDPTKEKWQVDKLRSGLYVQKFDDPDGFFRIQSDYTDAKPSQPFPASCWAAGFSFSRGDFFWEVGYDPYTPFLFFGEEMDISARGWTHGWDFFSPAETVVFHNYKRDHRRTFWENPLQWPLEVLSRFRVYVRLGYLTPQQIPPKYHFILKDIERFPLGSSRTLQEYEQYCRMNIKEEFKME